MRIVDTHCHLNDPSYKERIEQVISNAIYVGVLSFIVPSYDFPSLEYTADLGRRFSNIHPALGIHPWYADRSIDLNIIEELVLSNKAIAIGEIGLDFSEEIKIPEELQIEFFIKQVEIAIKLGLPILVHCRKAHQKMLELIKPYNGRLRGVMHSFSGNQTFLSEFLSCGFYISFSGAVTRSHAKKYHRSAINTPDDRILFETDAPAISTQNVSAENIEPRDIIEIVKFVADLRGKSLEDMAEISTRNATALFGEII